MGYDMEMDDWHDDQEYFRNRNKGIKKMTKKRVKNNYFKLIFKWINELNKLLISIFVFAIISGLLFSDPFGVIKTISILITNLGDNGMAGIISLFVIILWSRKI